MKKVYPVLFLAALVILTGCTTSGPEHSEESLGFTYNSCTIQPHCQAAPIIDVLGEPISYTEEASCAFEGLDKTYYYGNFYLTTYPLDGEDYLYRIWFVDDTVATDEGLRIGNTQAETETALGADCFNGVNTYTLIKGNAKLTVILTDGLVSSIQYEAIWN